MKKFGLLFLLLSAPVLSYAAFSDVHTATPYSNAIDTLQEEGILQGYEDGSFRPNTTISRAEFIKILVAFQLKLAGKKISPCDVDYFSDVPRTAWYAPYVCAGKKDGLIEGYPDGTFRPEAKINFAEVTKITSAFFNTLNTFCSGSAPIAGPDGCPMDSGHPWYEWYVRSIGHRGAIPYSIERLDQFITRGEMAEIVDRVRTVRAWPSRSYDELVSMNTVATPSQFKEYKKNIEDALKTTHQFKEFNVEDLRIHLEQVSNPYVRGTFYEPWAKKIVPFLATNREESGKTGDWGVFYEYQQVPISCSIAIWDYGFPQSMALKVCNDLE